MTLCHAAAARRRLGGKPETLDVSAVTLYPFARKVGVVIVKAGSAEKGGCAEGDGADQRDS